MRRFKTCLSIALFCGFLSPAVAGVSSGTLPTPMPTTNDLIVVAVRCGPGTFENHRGVCRPASERRAYSHKACPPGYHLGPHRKWCWPN